MKKVLFVFLGILGVNIAIFVCFGFGKIKKDTQGANVILLDNSIKREINSFVDSLYSNYPKMVQHRKYVSVNLLNRDNEFIVNFTFSNPNKCVESFKGVIDYDYKHITYLFITDTEATTSEKFFKINSPIICLEEKVEYGTKLIINNEVIIEPLDMTWAVIQKEICYDDSSDEWFTIE